MSLSSRAPSAEQPVFATPFQNGRAGARAEIARRHGVDARNAFHGAARDPHPWRNQQERATWTCRPSSKSDLARPLDGRVAVVTGSTSGIGLGIARALTQAGADVVINGLGDPARDRARAAPSSSALSPVSRVVYNGANLMKADEATGLIEETIAEFGRVDILVNNAGIQHVSPIESFPPEKFEAIIALNLSAAWYTIRAAFARDEGATASAGSSTSPRRTASSPRRSRAPMSRPSTASSA